jgi:hypothetical protein
VSIAELRPLDIADGAVGSCILRPLRRKIPAISIGGKVAPPVKVGVEIAGDCPGTCGD